MLAASPTRRAPRLWPSFHFMGLEQLRRPGPTPAPGALRVPPASISLPGQYAHSRSTKTKSFPREQRDAPTRTHCHGRDGRRHPGLGSPGQAGHLPVLPSFAGQSPVCPKLSPVRASGRRRFQLL